MTQRPRIAIPIPTANDIEYNRRAWPQYAAAVEAAGAAPVEVPLDAAPADIARLVTSCQAILLPGSPADVNPQRYGALPDPATNAADPARESVDDMLLQDAHNLHKPIFGICYGLQSLNVWRSGTLLQDLAPMPVNHKAGRSVAVAHSVQLDPDSSFAALVSELVSEPSPLSQPPSPLKVSGEFATAAAIPAEDLRPVAGTAAALSPADRTLPRRISINSSHHQAIGIVGDGLRVVARCPEDGVVEAVEGTAPDHFVMGVQWHPERTLDTPASKALFTRFVEEATRWVPRPITESVY